MPGHPSLCQSYPDPERPMEGRDACLRHPETPSLDDRIEAPIHDALATFMDSVVEQTIVADY